jgi:hypothetical protein
MAEKTCNFEEFTDMVHSLLNAAWESEWGTFTEAFPNGRDPKKVSLPIITYLIKEKRPGIVGNNRSQEIKPRFRQESVNEESLEGGPKILNIYSQIFDHDIVFEIWEENNAKANKLAERFEDFMMVYKGYFMKNGVSQIIFDHMNGSPESSSFREDIVVRKFVYLVRLEKHTIVPSDVIDKVTASVTPLSTTHVSDDLSDDYIDSSDSIKFRL